MLEIKKDCIIKVFHLCFHHGSHPEVPSHEFPFERPKIYKAPCLATFLTFQAVAFSLLFGLAAKQSVSYAPSSESLYSRRRQKVNVLLVFPSPLFLMGLLLCKAALSLTYYFSGIHFLSMVNIWCLLAPCCTSITSHPISFCFVLSNKIVALASKLHCHRIFPMLHHSSVVHPSAYGLLYHLTVVHPSACGCCCIAIH